MHYEPWRDEILILLEQLSSKAFQLKSWTTTSKESSSPDELICSLMDDFLFEQFIKGNAPRLSGTQQLAGEELLESLRQFLSSSPTHLDAEAVIDGPLWDDVRQRARKFYSALRDTTL